MVHPLSTSQPSLPLVISQVAPTTMQPYKFTRQLADKPYNMPVSQLPALQMQPSPSMSQVIWPPVPKKIYDLPDFIGTPEDLPMFLAAYEHSTAAYQYSNFENCLRLQTALKGNAKEAVKSLLIHPDNVGMVLQQLMFQYGRPDLLIRCQIPAITENGARN